MFKTTPFRSIERGMNRLGDTGVIIRRCESFFITIFVPPHKKVIDTFNTRYCYY